MHTANHPAHERFDAWVELVSQTTVPVDVVTPDPASYKGSMSANRFGATMVASVTSSSCTSHRTQRHISRSDPGAVQVMLVTRGTTGVSQHGTESMLQAGDIAIHTTWRPFTVHAVADESGVVAGATAVIPRDELDLSTRVIEKVAAHAISGLAGSGGLLSGLLRGLAAYPRTSAADGARLACALNDLLAVTLSTMVGEQAALPDEMVQRTLFTQISAFIHQELDDSGLDPFTIAEAHHISLRSLHRLFESHGETVSGFIRRHRLKRCLRDLSDPTLRHRRIQDIAIRRGFRSPAHFNRLFKAETGMTPGQYRRARDTEERVDPSAG